MTRVVFGVLIIGWAIMTGTLAEEIREETPHAEPELAVIVMLIIGIPLTISGLRWLSLRKRVVREYWTLQREGAETEARWEGVPNNRTGVTVIIAARLGTTPDRVFKALMWAIKTNKIDSTRILSF